MKVNIQSKDEDVESYEEIKRKSDSKLKKRRLKKNLPTNQVFPKQLKSWKIKIMIQTYLIKIKKNNPHKKQLPK